MPLQIKLSAIGDTYITQGQVERANFYKEYQL